MLKVEDEGSHYDTMEMLSYKQFYSLLKRTKEDPSEHKALAAFIIKRGKC